MKIMFKPTPVCWLSTRTAFSPQEVHGTHFSATLKSSPNHRGPTTRHLTQGPDSAESLGLTVYDSMRYVGYSW